MISKRFRMGASVLASVALSACWDPSSHQPSTAVMPPSDIDGWAVWPRAEPILILVQEGGYHIQMQCRSSTLAVVVKNLSPAQTFPQPPMTIEINDFSWTGSPTAHMDEGVALLTADAYVFRDNLPHEALLDGFRRNTRMRLSFNDVDKALPVIPADVGKTFGDACEAALWR